VLGLGLLSVGPAPRGCDLLAEEEPAGSAVVAFNAAGSAAVGCPPTSP
jgi:hypothetical protein